MVSAVGKGPLQRGADVGLGLVVEGVGVGSGGSRMEAKGGLNSGYVGLKLEINKNLRLINPNLMNKSYL
jgi:hypothetical protein